MTTPTPAWGLDSVAVRLDGVRPTLLAAPDDALATGTGAGVRVAVVDSGIEADHPALEGCVDEASGVDVTVDDEGRVTIETGPHDDVFGHGTACAGIIHALAPAARITSVRVLGPDLTGRAAAFHAGLAWAVDEGFDVVNLSLGTTKAEWALAFHEVCDRAYFGGTFVVTAANNVRRTSYPSLFASVASVACTTTQDPRRYHVNPSPPTEFLARGIDVEVPWRNGTTTTSTGNSFAAPHIAGLAALVMAAHPELTPFQVKAALWAGAANVREAAAGGHPVEAVAPAGRTRAVTTSGGTAAALTQVVRVGPTSAPPATESARSLAAPTWTVGGYEAAGAARRTPWGVAIPARRGDQSVVVHDLAPVLDSRPGAADDVVAAVTRAAAVAHPHLEPVLEVVARGGPMVVTAAGGTLDGSEALPVADALAVALAMLAGLGALADRGLVHGDVRLGGTTVDGRGAVRLGWSGVAAVLGTPPPLSDRPERHAAAVAHLAPERLTGEPAGAASDVYGVGLALATLLAGTSPFPAVADPAALVRQRSRAVPTPTGTEGADLHPDLVAAVTAALDPTPEARPADAATFARVLTWAAEEAVGLDAVTASGRLRAR